MNTPSHLIINAALRKRVTANGPLQIPGSAFLLGAVLPDVPLTLLWIGSYLFERYVRGNIEISAMDDQFDQRYFTDPLWISAHNLMHAPVILLAVLTLLWRFRERPESRGGWWFWFAAGCLIHTMLDIPTHVTDGPLLFFPFEWSIRFHSMISYWDPRYHGREFTIFELILDAFLLAYLGVPWVARRLRKRRSGGDAGEQHL
ncbi:MAG: metal-dependent hydrolase [Roseiflexaceae bacterium]|nr:metal-dependent hydrolase [Roseiflexaceae bacterium]